MFCCLSTPSCWTWDSNDSVKFWDILYRLEIVKLWWCLLPIYNLPLLSHLWWSWNHVVVLPSPQQIFLVRRSARLQKKVISLRLPGDCGSCLKEFAIKESTYSKSLLLHFLSFVTLDGPGWRWRCALVKPIAGDSQSPADSVTDGLQCSLRRTLWAGQAHPGQE